MKPPRPDYWKRALITTTMADSRRENWEAVFGPFKDEIRKVLEVGSYEGQSALFWYHFFGARVTCIDTWENFAHGCRSAEEVEAHFDHNTRGLPIKKIKARSSVALAVEDEMGEVIYDLVYIDGDHSRLQVMADTCLAWPMLRPGGFMVWDDYRSYEPDAVDRPAPAIDAFLALMREQIEVLRDTGQQMMVRKKQEAT